MSIGFFDLLSLTGIQVSAGTAAPVIVGGHGFRGAGKPYYYYLMYQLMVQQSTIRLKPKEVDVSTLTAIVSGQSDLDFQVERNRKCSSSSAYSILLSEL